MAPNNSLKLTRRAGPSGMLVLPAGEATILVSLPASAGQLSSRPLGSPSASSIAGGLVCHFKGSAPSRFSWVR